MRNANAFARRGAPFAGASPRGPLKCGAPPPLAAHNRRPASVSCLERRIPMLLRLARLGVPAVLIAVLLASPAHAQGKGGGAAGQNPQNYPKLPKPEEIEKQAQEFLSKADAQTAELEGF